MARIKGVMNERRLAYEGAVELAERHREAAVDAAVLKFKVDSETTEWHKRHAEQLRQKVIPPPRTHRAGVKVRTRREANAQPEGEKKARWTKAQKLANAQYKQRQANAAASSRKQPAQRRVHVA